jgi:hypothetical protein
MDEPTFRLCDIGGRSVYRQLCQVREDGRTWLGAHWTDYDWQGKKVGERTTWNGYFTSSRGIDDPAIRARLPLWQRLAYGLGLYGHKAHDDDGSKVASAIIKNINGAA